MSTVRFEDASVFTAARKAASRRRLTNGDIGYPVVLVLFLLCTAVALWWVWADSGIAALSSFAGVGREAAWWLGQGLFWMTIGALLWRAGLALTYKPIPEAADADLPTLTVVVPAYNEGRHVLNTLVSVAASDYPADKLQIIAVDDGSKDDTWQWMCRAESMLPDRVEPLKLTKNGGKRRALYEGFRRATGAVWVTIDSDSLVDPDTLRKLVSPFVADERVGATAGNVRVLNLREGLIPKMMDVAFTLSFDFLRLAQSKLNTVFCTPGALSAYRGDVLAPHLEEWAEEQFMGRYANIGEDRGLANIILRKGFHILFQQNALVWTNVPVKYKGLCKMLVRWGRSNVRESIVMSQFIFSRFRETPALGTRVEYILQMIELVVAEALKIGSLGMLLVAPLMVGKNILVGTLIASSLPAVVYLLRHRSWNFLWAVPYSYFWIVGLSWIGVWSMITPHRSGWLTREVKSGLPVAAPATELLQAAQSPILSPAPIMTVDNAHQARA
ncbi:glycosyltransferase [Desulfovibrio aminophilus]|uniref:glycosyltransferase family 2 protein n=1 Tax=Desulfovibrio aminophilus TaxID=81425 RepID=UPI0033967DFE